MKIRSLITASLLLAGTGLAQASLVTNGSFESGLTGWSCSTSNRGGCGTSFQGINAVDGTAYFWGFDNNTSGVLSQSLATEAGASYSVSLIFNTTGTVPPNALGLSVSDLSQSLALVRNPNAWGSYSGVFTASGASTALNFAFATASGSGTVLIDSVVVERIGSVPVPTSLALAALGLAGLAASRRAKAA